jgi:hypothetical protein
VVWRQRKIGPDIKRERERKKEKKRERERERERNKRTRHSGSPKEDAIEEWTAAAQLMQWSGTTAIKKKKKIIQDF